MKFPIFLSHMSYFQKVRKMKEILLEYVYKGYVKCKMIVLKKMCLLSPTLRVKFFFQICDVVELVVIHDMV